MAVSAKQVQELRRRTGAGIMDCKKALNEANGDEEQAIALLKEWGIAKAAKKGGREASEGILVAVISDDLKEGALIGVNCETDFVANTDEYKAFANKTAELIFSKGYSSADEFDEATTNAVKEGIAQFKENIIIGSIKRIKSTGGLYSYIHTNFKNGTIAALEGNADFKSEAIETVGKDVAVHISANSVAAVSEEDMNPKILEAKKAEFSEEIKAQGKPENIIEKIVTGKMNKFLKEETLLAQPFLKDEDVTVKQFVENSAKAAGAELKVTAFIKTVMGE